MPRYALQKKPRDQHGNRLAGVAFKIYPFNAAATWYSEAANGDWTVLAAGRPPEVSVYAVADDANTTTTALLSQADGSTQVGWLPEGAYTVVAEIGDGAGGTRYFVEPQLSLGPEIFSAAIGGIIAAGDDRDAGIAKLVAAIEANQTAITALQNEATLGQFLGSAATFAALSTLETGERSPGDWADLTSDVVGTGTVAAPQYPAGRYKVQPNDTFAFDRAYGDSATPAQIDLVTTDVTGAAVPAGKSLAIDTTTGNMYVPDGAGNWTLLADPAEPADPATMTFA